MSFVGIRTSELLDEGVEAKSYQVNDTDVIWVWDEQDTTSPHSGPGGGLKPLRISQVGDAVSRRTYPPVRLSQTLDKELSVAWGMNTSNNTWNNCVIEESTPGTRRLWCVYVDKDHHPILARKTILSNGGVVPSDWATIDLTTKFTANGGIIGNDPHRFLALHIDSDGYVHVMGGMHGDTDVGYYCVSRVPYSMTLADYVPAEFNAAETNNTKMTYPQFVGCDDGSFVLVYRDGTPPGGVDHRSDTWVKRYTPNGSAPPASGENTRWSTAVLFHDGINDPIEFGSIYPGRIATDPRDRATHAIAWLWRNDDDETVEKLGCAITRDDFATFELVDGTPLTLPFDRSDYAGAMIVDNVPNQSNASFLVDSCCFDFVPTDPDDPTSISRLHITYTKTVSGTRRMYRAWWNGTTWTVNQIGSTSLPNQSTSLMASPQGGMFIAYGSRSVGGVRLIDVTPEKARTYADVRMIDFEYGQYQCAVQIPQQPMLDFNEAVFLMIQDGGYNWGGETRNPEIFHSDGHVVHVDLTRLSDIASGRYETLKATKLGTLSIPNIGTEIEVSQTVVDSVGMPGIALSEGWPLARFVGFAKVDSGSELSLHIAQLHPSSGTEDSQVVAEITSTTYVEVITPWVPLRQSVFLTSGEISMWAGITTGSGKGYFRGRIELEAVPQERV